MGSCRRAAAAGWSSGHQHGENRQAAVLLKPICPLTTAKVLARKTTVLLMLLQTLVVLAAAGGLTLAVGAAGFSPLQRRRSAMA